MSQITAPMIIAISEIFGVPPTLQNAAAIGASTPTAKDDVAAPFKTLAKKFGDYVVDEPRPT